MSEQPQAETISTGHEPIETGVRGVWLTGVVLTGVVVASFVLIAALMKGFYVEDREPPVIQTTGTDLVEPRQLQELQARERKLLSEYQWVDPAAGVARIPIDRAIQIAAKEGSLKTQGGTAKDPNSHSSQSR
jgi:hypothetical protein